MQVIVVAKNQSKTLMLSEALYDVHVVQYFAY